MPLSNAERQRHYRQRHKDELAELAKLMPALKLLAEWIADKTRVAVKCGAAVEDTVLGRADAAQLAHEFTVQRPGSTAVAQYALRLRETGEHPKRRER